MINRKVFLIILYCLYKLDPKIKFWLLILWTICICRNMIFDGKNTEEWFVSYDSNQIFTTDFWSVIWAKVSRMILIYNLTKILGDFTISSQTTRLCSSYHNFSLRFLSGLSESWKKYQYGGITDYKNYRIFCFRIFGSAFIFHRVQFNAFFIFSTPNCSKSRYSAFGKFW